MTGPRDEIDDWLSSEVEPLAPPPGTFDRVHRRARRRKLNQALFAAAGAVVVIAGATLALTLGAGLLTGGGGAPRPAAAGSASARSPSPAPTVSKPGAAASPASPPLLSTGLSNTTSGANAPAHFRPTSITMVGVAVGAVIGQAGPPCATSYCTSLAGTSTYGASWYGVSAPRTGAPDSSKGVSQLRFLNLNDGWAYGPALQETSDGGRSWTPVPTGGLRVTGLEAAGSRAFVLLAGCRGTGAGYTARCSTFSLYSAAADSATLQKVTLVIPASLRPAAMSTGSQGSSASLVIRGNTANVQAGTGYLLAPSGDILSGSVGGGAWKYLGQAPCQPGAAAPSGAPLGAQLTVSGSMLLLNCVSGGSSGGGGVSGSGSSQPKQLWESADGIKWSKASQPPATGTATSLASGSAGQAVLATTAGIDYSPAGATWQQAAITGGTPAGGFSYVGMTSDTHGVALPVDASLGEVFVTTDGGQTWTASPVSG